MSPHERIDLLTSARPSLPNATATQAAGYRMWYGPVIEPGHRANAPTEVGIRVMALAVRSGFADDEQAKNSLVDSAFEMELKRLELVRRVFEEREKAVADLRARGAGMRDYVAYHIDNDAIYVIQPGQFPDLDAAVEELTRCERKDRASLEEQARRYAR